MKNKIIRNVLGVVAIIIFIAATKSVLSPCDSPTVGDHSGAPGETNCSGCHSSPVNPDIPDLHFEAGNNDSTYVPGNTYLIHIKIKRNGHDKFGFVCSSLDTNNNSKGAFTLINSALTRIYTLGGRNYVSHTPCGADSQDSATWTFNWIAPATNLGKVKIYMSMLVANHNEDLTGDTTYTRILTLNPSSNNGIAFFNSIKTTTVYPTSFHNSFTIEFNEHYNNSIKQVYIYSIEGRLIETFKTSENKILYTLNSLLDAGVYMIRINYIDKSEMIKIYKN